MMKLAPYAATPEASLGRLHPVEPSPTRTPFQRDRDRIVHSAAFRRLVYKTQVFVYHEGDHYRTRLTHTLEVAQIARSLARSLNVNEDLVEPIALAHDLGHTPFGHAGEDALNAAMQDVGGFDHNAHSLALVTSLEGRYAAFEGLDLTFETLEGIVKHNGPLIAPDGTPIKKYAKGGIPRAVRAYNEIQDLRLDTEPTLEAQLAALADDIAYNNHDIDDGFRAGFIAVDDLQEVPIAARAMADVRARHGDIPASQLVYEMNRRMIAAMVQDVLDTTLAQIREAKPKSVDDVRHAGRPLAQFSREMSGEIADLRAFLFAHVYKHPATLKKMQAAQLIVQDLYDFYCANPDLIEADERQTVQGSDEIAQKWRVGNFVAGMTDRYALKAYAKHVGRKPQTSALFDGLFDFS
jgi:dGTPase